MSSTTGGLLRLPRFLRTVLSTARAEQATRDISSPTLLTPSACVADILIVLCIAATVFSLRVFLHRFVFPRLFARYSPKLHAKLSETTFYSIYYTLASAYYLTAVHARADWAVDLLHDGASIVRGLIHPVPPPIAPAEHLYYAQSAGFYLSATAFLLLFDGRRSGFGEFLLHHVVTLGLFGVSYAYGYVRVGIVIIALHDVADIFLYTAKLLHHLGFAGLDTTVFGVFAVAFYVTRLLMLPRVVYAIGVETLQTLVEEPAFNGWAKYFDVYLWHYSFFVVLLGTLLVLHCFWFALVLKMIYRQVFLGKNVSVQGDIRSDDEDNGVDDPAELDDDFLSVSAKED